MNHAEIIEKLCSIRNHGSKFGIDRMRLLCEAIASPHNHFASIHIAGTNGKGSTAAMIEATLRERGLRVGLYTSPHLVKLGERVQVNRNSLSDEQVCKYTEELYSAAKKFGAPGDDDYPSFFEFMTAMAFLHFARERCDVAVIETGLGGRLDATNILQPKVCAITSIGLDHCDMLGDTIAKIAGEKAGIIKCGVPVVMGCVPADAENVIRKTAAEKNALLISVRERFGEKIENFPMTNLFGDHQRHNAGTAKIACEIFLGEKVEKLPRVSWDARWETKKLSDGRELILDVAHNAECAQALDSMLTEHFRKTEKKPTIVVGVLGMDRARPIVSAVAKHAGKIIFVRPEQDRACSLDELRSCVPADFSGSVEESSVPALFPEKNFCSVKTPNGEPIIVAGSCYLAGEIISALAGTSDENESFLQDKIKTK